MNNITIILPSLNPDEKMVELIKSLKEIGFNDIVMVNDGSDKNHLHPFLEAEKKYGCYLLTHEVNKGKGRALKTAFNYVRENRPNSKGIITVDGDGQHLPKDILKCANELLKDDSTIIFGTRDFSSAKIPFRSMLGNKVTALTFQMLLGMKITDTQTGLRGIPSKFLEEFCNVDGERYEYETNMILYMNKRKINFKEVIISTVYIDENSSSHFNPLADSLKIYGAIFKFAVNSACSSGIDIGLFTVLNIILPSSMDKAQRILIATIIARVVSALFNYYINHSKVFNSSEPHSKAMVKYTALCVVQTMTSFGLVYGVSNLFSATKIGETIIKIVVDVCLFFISYKIQKRWVFGNKTKISKN